LWRIRHGFPHPVPLSQWHLHAVDGEEKTISMCGLRMRIYFKVRGVTTVRFASNE
jgi:hypothetical protein